MSFDVRHIGPLLKSDFRKLLFFEFSHEGCVSVLLRFLRVPFRISVKPWLKKVPSNPQLVVKVWHNAVLTIVQNCLEQSPLFTVVQAA